MTRPRLETPTFPTPTSIDVLSPPASAEPVEESLHELRVRIPVDLHRQLLSLKILRGKSLADTVSSALDVYFAEHERAAHEVAQ